MPDWGPHQLRCQCPPNWFLQPASETRWAYHRANWADHHDYHGAAADDDDDYYDDDDDAGGGDDDDADDILYYCYFY